MHRCAPAPRSGRSVVRDRSDNSHITRHVTYSKKPSSTGRTPREIRASVVGPSAPRRRRRGRRSPPAVGAALSRDTRTYGNFNSEFAIIPEFLRCTTTDRSVPRVLYTQRLTRTKGEETIAPRHARILRRPPPKLASVESRHATPRTCTPLAQGPGPADLWGHADARETPTRRTRQQEHLHSRRPAAGESPAPPRPRRASLCLSLSLSDALAITPRWLCHALHRAQSPIRYQYVIVPSHPHPETRCLSRASLHAHSAAAT
jgi:hypothetical protein